MIYIGPEKKLRAKKKVGSKVVAFEYDGRVLYADTYNEMMNIVHKMGCSTSYIKRYANYLTYRLSRRHSWKPLYYKKKYNIQVEELTLMQEAEYVENKNMEHQILKREYSSK